MPARLSEESDQVKPAGSMILTLRPKQAAMRMMVAALGGMSG